MKTKKGNWVIAFFLICLGLASAGFIPMLVSVGITWVPAMREASFVLTLLLIAGVIGLLSALALVSVALAAINLSDRNQALGLPKGTVRAVIALSLILIFVMTATYLYGSLARSGLGEVYTSTGISKEMFMAWPADEIVSIRATQVTTDTTVYDVVREVGQSEASEDFASQILTTVSTLVVAIAGFYFGTRAVAVARDVAVSPEPSIKGIEPRVGEAGKKEVPVKISGKDFDGPVVVKLVKGWNTVQEIRDPACSSKEIACTFNLEKVDPGVYDLVVVNQDGGKDQEDEMFTVTAVPTVDSITPNTGKGKVPVAINGKNFVKGAGVRLKQAGQVDIPVAVEDITPTRISCTLDLTDKTGKWDVVVINPGEKEGKKAQAFTVTE